MIKLGLMSIKFAVLIQDKTVLIKLYRIQQVVIPLTSQHKYFPTNTKSYFNVIFNVIFEGFTTSEALCLVGFDHLRIYHNVTVVDVFLHNFSILFCSICHFFPP